MMALRFFLVLSLLMTGVSLVQPTRAQEKPPANSEDPQRETEWLQQELALLKLEHSDSSGKVRPDLRAKGIAQMQRMNVVTEFGATAPREKMVQPSNPIKK